MDNIKYSSYALGCVLNKLLPKKIYLLPKKIYLSKIVSLLSAVMIFLSRYYHKIIFFYYLKEKIKALITLFTVIKYVNNFNWCKDIETIQTEKKNIIRRKVKKPLKTFFFQCLRTDLTYLNTTSFH